MFNSLLHELEDLARTKKITIPVAADERGYLDKECPSAECEYQFKVLEEDWRALFHDEAVFCPMCGHSAPADRWWTTEQVEEARKRATEYLTARLDSALRHGAAEFNREHKSTGFITMSMRVAGAPRRVVILPLRAAEVFEQRISCSECGARHAVVGAAFFCPCCGHNSVERMFEASLQNVRSKVDHLDPIRVAVNDANGPDVAESMCRSILEDGLQHCVTAFQHYAERTYRLIPGLPAPRINVFQRLHDGDALWRVAIGAAYEDWLSSKELARLQVLFARRHLLAHRNGIVDEKYVATCSDNTYQAGQRIVVTARDVRELADLIERLGRSLRRATEARLRSERLDLPADNERPR